MNKKGMSKRHQRRLTLVGVASVLTIWIAALALLFSQPGSQSNGTALPTLASGLQEVAKLPDTGAVVTPMSPTLLPTSLPVELPADSLADTALVSAPANPIPEILPTQPTRLTIPDEPVPNSLVIRFKPEMTQAERLAYIASLGGQIVEEIKPLNTVIISLPDNAAAGIQSQSVVPGVLENEPDYYAGALYAPNDALAAGQWGLDVVKAPQAWDLLPATTANVTVAVIDSGICANHADLQGRIASNGWDFIDNDSAPQDEFGHGCAVSGIIAANSNNGLGIAGVAPNATVMPLRVLDAGGIGRYSDVAAAIVYAVDNGAGAINLSLGGPNPSAVLQDAVNYAEARGVTVIAAAGNNGAEQVYYPAAYPSVVAVGSVSQDLQRSPFSNYGAGIDLYAPGDGIMTTSLDGSFQNYSGTSVAAPYVTGVWALRQAMGKALVLDGGIVSALYASDAPVPTEEPPSELCLLSDTQAAEAAYFNLVQQNASQPGSISAAQLEAARAAYLGLAEPCANVLYDGNIIIDGGGISPFAGEISPLFQIFGTKWQQESPASPQTGAAFNQGQPPAVPGGIIKFSFMPTNVSLAAKEVENGGGANAFITDISDLPNNAQCDLKARIRQAFTAWGSVANVEFVEVTETGLVPFGGQGDVGDIRVGAQIIDGMKGELGHAYFPPPDPEIATSTRSGDIFLDRAEVWGCAPSPAGVEPRVLDIGLVVLHELGHSLGMQHERAAGVLALMNPAYNTALITDAAGGTLSLTDGLRSDDQSGARAIYGGIGVSAPALQPVLDTDTDNTPTFPWRDTVTSGSDYFEVQIVSSENGLPGDTIFDGTTSGGVNPADPPAKSFTIPNALQSLPYLWRVRAFAQGAWGVWSQYNEFNISVGIPALLSPTAGQVLNSGDIQFQWGQTGGATTYLLQVATQAEFTPESLVVDQTVAGTFFTPPTLADGTYYWRVQTGTNPFSVVNSFRVDAAALVVDLSPGAPNAAPADGFAFVGAGANENITLQWDALPDVSEYQLQLDTSENFVGLLFLDKLFLDKLFLDKLFLDKLFLDKLFLDKLFLDKLQTSEELFLDKLFLDKLFLDKLFLDKLFLDKLFLDKLFLDKLFLDKLFLDKLFLDKLFLDKIEYTGGATASFTFDTLPLSEGVHYWRVRPRLPDGSFGPWSVSRSFEVRTQPTKVVINEIKLSDPSWIEFRNTGVESANMGGWQFFAYGPSGETQLLYTFPAGFTMPAGGYSVLYEGVGTDTDRALYTGGNQINWPLTAQGNEASGTTLNGFGTVVTVPGLTSTDSGATAQIISLPSLPIVEPVTNLVGEVVGILGIGDVTALTNFNIAIGDTVSDGVPGAGAGNIEVSGSNDTYTFPATAGQVVLFDSLGSSTGAIRWELRDPSNGVIFDVSTSANGGEHTLAETGNYTIRVYSNSAATGTYSFRTVEDTAQTGPTLAVNTTNATDDGVCSTLDCSLIEAINASNAQAGANTIELATDAVYTLAAVNNNVNGATGLPAITTEITINGNGSTITRSSDGGTPQFRFFHISSGSSLALNALSLTAGDAGGADGGAIFTSGSLILTNVTLANNSANQGGSLLIASGGSAAISDSYLTSNTSTFLGGGFYVQSGGSAAVSNTVIDLNQGGSYGGGLYADGALTISDSTIVGNTAGGGAGLRACCNGIINITSTTIANNIASSYAGGIMTIGVQLNLVNSTLSGNVVLAPASEGFNGRGGAILNRLGGTVNISNSTIVGNNAEEGGGLANESTITIKNSLVAAQANGGNCFGTAIATQGVNFVTDTTCGSASPTLNVVSDTALNLGALADNGGPTQTIALGAGSSAINAVIDCTTLSSAAVNTDQRGNARPQGAQCDAGAYEAAAGGTPTPTYTPTMTPTPSMTPTPPAGSLTVTTTQMIQDGLDGQCSLPEAIIAANTGTPSGGGAGECVPSEGSDTITLGTNQIYTLTQVDNVATSPQAQGANGLPVITSTITLVMNGSTIRRASDALEDFRIFYVNASGDLNITGNAGTISGARGRSGGAFLNEGSLAISNTTISGNFAESGAAITNYGTLNVVNSAMADNQAKFYGGAIYNIGQLTLTQNILKDNKVGSESIPGSYGGALFTGGTANVDTNSFIGNQASGFGGAIFNSGTLTVVNATISGNQAPSGSAILSDIGVTTVNILHTTIADNITTDNARGAVENGGGTLTLTNSIIANNSGGANCSGTITDGGGNIQYGDESCVVYFDTANPLLGELTQAGSAYFYPLLIGSPALDRGTAANCTAFDIRGVARPAGNCDSGSYEGSVALTGNLTVTTTNPAANPTDGLCSLVEAIDAANTGNASGSAPGECVPSGGADTITLGTGLTYTLGVVNNTHLNGSGNGLPAITSPITIDGNGSTITRSSEAQFRIFYVAAAGDLTLNNATLSNGFGDPGGAILSDGSLTLNSSSIADNNASSGGGLFLNGATIINNSSITGNNGLSPDGGGIFVNGNATLTMTNSTVSGNSASGVGGGVVTGFGSNVVVEIFNSTIANNTAAFGAGISVFGGSVTIFNTIIANNSGGNCSGAVADGGASGSSIQWPGVDCTDTITIVDPLLGPLTGSPAYLPLGAGSPAIDAADPAFCPAVDQRGVPRAPATCDIGAVETTEAPALVPGTTGGAAALVSPLTTDFVRFGDTTLGPAIPTEWTGNNVAVTDSGDNNVTIGRDPSSSDTNHVTDWATQRPTEGGQNFSSVLINEVYTGSNDYVELFNPRAETANISDWELKLYDAADQLILAAPGATYTVRLPSGTLLRPGEFLIVGETDPGNGVNFIPAGPPINWDDANASGAVTLTNGLTPIDFVRFGSSQANQLVVEPPPGMVFSGIVQSPLPGESIGRNSLSEDANAAPDWYSQVRSAGAVNPAIAPPANDAFTGATTIDSVPFRDTGDTTNASAVNDPVLSCGASVGHTVWYKYTPTATQTIRLQTDGSDFDTVLAVFTLNAGAPTQIAGLCSQRDDENNPQPGSRLSFTASAGTTYYILIGGQLNVSGQYLFSVNAPVNDDVNNAGVISALPFTTYQLVSGQRVSDTNTTAASTLASDPTPTCAPSAGRSVWYRYDATDATKLRWRTSGTLFDTVIAVYTGTVGNLVEVACNNDDAGDTTSDLGFTPVAGTTYYIQVSGNSDQGGDLLFAVDVFPTPDNDLIGDAFTVTPDGDGTFSVTTPAGTTPAPFAEDTTGATSSDDPMAAPADQCGVNPGSTVWFSYTADTADTVVFQTFGSSYDTSLSIWTGDLLTPASLTQLFCNDDVSVNKDSRLTLGDLANAVAADVQVTVGTTYYIGVSGYFGETGDLIFNAFTPQITPPENDRAITPFDITFNADDGTYSVIGLPANETTPFVQDTTGAFPEFTIPEPPPAGWLSEAGLTVPTPTCGDDVGYTVWYRYAAPERQQIVFDAAGSDFDTVITAYVQQGDQLVEVGCNDDFEGRAQSKLTLNTDAGVTLYLLFGGFKRDRGNLGLVISQSIAVTSFTLVDASDGSANVDPLIDGAVLAVADLPAAISIRANTNPEEVGSVKFELSGAAVLTSTDNEAPYALNGNNAPPDGSYIPWLYAPGTYTLKATPYSGNNALGRPGTPLTITFTISDNQPPLITADTDPIVVNEGLGALNSGTFSDPDADPVTLSAAPVGTVTDQGDGTWQWSFPTTDGPAESQLITITADDGQPGGIKTVTFQLTVNNVAPTASLSSSLLNASTARLTFSNQADASSVDQTAGFKYSYDCDNDGTFDLLGINLDAATFDCVYAVSGNYTARGRIADKDGGFTDSTVEIVIVLENPPPVADAGDDQTLTDVDDNGSENVTLDGSGSTDDGTIESYIWTEIISGVPTQIATGVNPTVALNVGTHTITLTVTDDGGAQGTDEVVIDILAAPVIAPTADAGADQVVHDTDRNGSELVTLNGSASSDDGTIVSYIWTEIIGGVPTQIATGVNPTITLAVGPHTITLTVTDDDNAQDTDEVIVKVNAPPNANAGSDQSVSAGTNNVSLDGSLSTDSDGAIVGYSWSENGVEFSTQVAPTITRPVGIYTITLTVTDNNGATGTDSVVITVIAQNQAPVVTASANPTIITLPTNSVNLSATATDDGLPAPSTLAYNWTAVNPPAPVTFGTPSALNTTALFTTAGSYTLRFTASDGQLTAAADVIVTVLPANTGPITVDDQVELSSDDVNEDGNSYDARNPQLWFGTAQSVSKSYMGLRFNNLEIPKGAVITEAHIEVYTATAQWIRMRILVGGEAVDDSATFTSATRPSTRAFTAARLNYQSNAPWPAATWNNIGDVKAVVQEIVNRPGWLPGNSLSILIKGLGSQWGRKFVTSYDGNPAFAPRLVVTYAGGPPPANNAPDVNVDAPSVTTNEGVLASITGTVSDPDNNPVTLTASMGAVQKNGNTWSWSYIPPDGPANSIVTITAADNRGGSDSVTFNLIVNNVAPTASFSAQPLSTFPNNPVTLTFSSPVDVAADMPGLIYTFDCGNGVTQTGAATGATCTYAATGTFTALGRITDKDGGYSDYQATITISDTPTEPTTITPQVNSSSDDVNENAASFQVNSPTVWVGTEGSINQSYTGLRFNNLGVPAGATITNAYLELYVPNSQWIGVDVLIAAEAADNSLTFTSGSRPSSRPLTVSRVEHRSNASWSANTWNTLTGNLSGVVQEVVSRAGWQAGNSLSLILKGTGSAFGRKFATSYDGNPAFAPRLVIQYTVPSAPEPLIIVPPPAPIILPTPPTAAFSSDVSSGVAPLAVTFSNLSTGDIAGYSWDFGDGSGGTDASPSHPYGGAGAFTVTLTVTGLDGTTSAAQAVINVTAPPPAIEVAPPPPIEEATPVPTEEVSAVTTEPSPEASAAP